MGFVIEALSTARALALGYTNARASLVSLRFLQPPSAKPVYLTLTRNSLPPLRVVN